MKGGGGILHNSCLTSILGKSNYESFWISNICHIGALFHLAMLREKTAIKNKSTCNLLRIFKTTS